MKGDLKLVCTNQGRHDEDAEQLVGVIGRTRRGGLEVLTEVEWHDGMGGTHTTRYPAMAMLQVRDGLVFIPEKCPVCGRQPRLAERTIRQITNSGLTDKVDVSYLDNYA